MDNVVSLDAHRGAAIQRRADEYLLDLVKDGTTARWTLVDRIVHRPEFNASTLAKVAGYLDHLDTLRADTGRDTAIAGGHEK